MNNKIVNTKIEYTYSIMNKNILTLKQRYPFLNIGCFGKSAMGKKLIYIKIGRGRKEISYNASIHANEWITTVLLMKFIEDISNTYKNDLNIFNRKARDLVNNCSLYVLPMLNPDGVDLVLNNIDKKSSEYIKARKIAERYDEIRFPEGWKANIRGVDLNSQFPSMWNEAKKIKYKMGYDKPSPRGYVGKNPLSEKEAFSLYKFTKKHNFEIILSFHTQGEEIYYKYLDFKPKRYKEIANIFSVASGYNLVDVPKEQSYAGYRDWFIETYSKPGYTIEVGRGENPISIQQFDKIYSDNIGILVEGMAI